MHELSIANSVVTMVTGAVPDARVREVHLQVGALSGVVPAALEFAWDVACSGTTLAGSTLIIDFIPARIHCSHCGLDSDVSGYLVLVCPSCQQACADIRAGRELLVTHVVVDDEAPATSEPEPLGVGG